jgi:hypothetical protein
MELIKDLDIYDLYRTVYSVGHTSGNDMEEYMNR